MTISAPTITAGSAKSAILMQSAVKSGIFILLVFTPLAFGTVQPWSIAIMEIIAFGIFFLHIWTEGISLPQSRSARAILILFLILIGLVLLQMLPLPRGILSIVSPGALVIWRKFGSAPVGSFLTVSLYPDATRQELLKLLAYVSVFVVVARCFRTRARIMFLVKTILVMAGFLVIVAVAQKITWNGRIFWIFPVEEYLRRDHRIWGPYINHNHFAFYLEMALPLALAMLVYLSPDSKNAKGAPSIRRLGLFLASDKLVQYVGIFLLVVLLSACILSTLSRGAILASAVSSLFFAWNTWRRRSLRKKGIQVMLAAAAIGLLVLFPAWDRVVQRFEDIEEKQHLDRLYILKDSLGMLKDFPLFGTGFGTFDQGFRRYQTKRSMYFYDHAHNDYLEMATDTGIAGFILAGGIVVIFLLSLMRGWRNKKSQFGKCMGAGGISSCVALSVHSGTDFNLHIPANALLFAVIAGLTYAVIFTPSASKASQSVQSVAALPGSSLRTISLGLGALVLACLAMSLPARDFLADSYYRQVARNLDDKTTEELDVLPITDETIPLYLKAVESLKRAAAIAPLRSNYPKALADHYSMLGAWAATMESLKAPLPAIAITGTDAFAFAVAEGKRAVSLEPTNQDHHLALGQTYAAADGNLGRADEQLRLAVAANPVNAPLRYSVAMLYSLSGRRTEALEQARELAQLDDSYYIPESVEKTKMIERRTQHYLSRLSRSYLFQALEIAWRSTGDINLVKSIAPQTDDARAVVDLFIEWKGIEE